MNFDRFKTAIAFVVLIALSTVAATGLRPTDQELFWVFPMRVAFGFVILALGVKHGEYRARR